MCIHAVSRLALVGLSFLLASVPPLIGFDLFLIGWQRNCVMASLYIYRRVVAVAIVPIQSDAYIVLIRVC